MFSSKNLFIFALVVTLAGLGGLAWQQRQALRDLEAKRAGLSAEERGDFEKRLASAERARASLERDLAEARKRPPAGDRSGVAKFEAIPDRAGGPFGKGFLGGDPFGMENPQMQKYMASQQRSGLDSRYAALFKALKLSPEALEKFQALLVDKQTSPMDVMAAARNAGLNPRENPQDYNALMRNAMAEIDASIRSTLGEAGFAQYTEYEKTQAQRMVANQLAQRLSYSNSPLTDSQTEQLIRILAETSPQSGNAITQFGATNTFTNVSTTKTGAVAFVAGPGLSMSFGGLTSITDDAISRASSVLSASQLQALTQLQQQQRDQAAMMESMRKQAPNVSGAGGTFISREVISTLPVPAGFTPVPDPASTRPPGGE